MLVGVTFVQVLRCPVRTIIEFICANYLIRVVICVCITIRVLYW